MQPPYPSVTPTWHNDTYPALDPSRPEHSAKGKTVVITGAGTGIGRATALSFQTAGASHIVLLGRTPTTLSATASALRETPQRSSSISTHAVDVTDEAGLRAVAAQIGEWHVLVLSAAYLSSPQEARTADVGEWWKSFETNVKGALLCVQAFLSTACASLGPDTPSPAPLSPHATTTTATDPQPSPQDDDGNRRASPTILALTTGAISFPRHTTLGHSAYTSSKLAQTCLFEFVAAENSDVMVASVHPGMVATGIAEKAGMLNGRFERPMDSVSLPANFLVWMASPGARFLRGRVVWANWDVEELMQKRQEIEADETFLTVGVVGWDRLPYGGTA